MKLLPALILVAASGCTDQSTTVPLSAVQEVEPGFIQYMAMGAQPVWQVVVDREKITLTFDREGRGGPGSTANYFYPLVTPRREGGTRIWETRNGTELLSIQARPEPCRDDQGAMLEDSVRVIVGARELTGCGGAILEERNRR